MVCHVYNPKSRFRRIFWFRSIYHLLSNIILGLFNTIWDRNQKLEYTAQSGLPLHLNNQILFLKISCIIWPGLYPVTELVFGLRSYYKRASMLLSFHFSEIKNVSSKINVPKVFLTQGAISFLQKRLSIN